MEPATVPPGKGMRRGLALLLVGGLTLGYAAYGLSTLPLPNQVLGPDAGAAEQTAALELFRDKLDQYARVQAGGLLLVALGVVAVAIDPIDQRQRRILLGVGVAGALLVLLGRLRSLEAAQFSARWDHWLAAEAAGWVVWAIVVAGALVVRSTREPV